MCGVCGIVARARADLDPEAVARMCDTLAHRGPDHSGSVLLAGGRISLGHRRLSIVDLSPAGHQPMSNEDATVWVSYNGEIYNHPDLRRELEAGGHRFASRSDTEVIVHLYEEHGIDLVHRLRGVFAFALWDDRKKSLYLARDRLGLKPLYYADTPGGFVFASEAKALFASGLVAPALDPTHLPQYLNFGRVVPPHTLFQGVHKLEPGHILEYEGDGIPRTRAYWDVFDGIDRAAVAALDDDGLISALRSKLEESVGLRLMGDVPVGVLLSSGIDSGTVAALVALNAEVPLRTFTVGFAGEHVHSEIEGARAVSRLLGSTHHDLVIGPSDARSFFPRYLDLMEEPGSNPVWMAIYFVTRLAREHGVIVALTGDGGDELFIGYEKWIAVLKLHKYIWEPFSRLPGPARMCLSTIAKPLLRDRAMADLARAAAVGEELYQGGTAFKSAEVAALVRPEVLERAPGLTPHQTVAAHRERFLASAPDPKDYADWMTYVGLKTGLLEDNLMRLDKMGMGASVEGRAPLLDHELLRLAMSVPGRRKHDGWRRKRLLKEVAEQLLPPETTDAPKLGFNAPVQAWISEEFADTMADSVASFEASTGLLTKSGVEWLKHVAHSSRGPAAGSWGIMSLALWHTHWVAR